MRELRKKNICEMKAAKKSFTLSVCYVSAIWGCLVLGESTSNVLGLTALSFSSLQYLSAKMEKKFVQNIIDDTFHIILHVPVFIPNSFRCV
jgi:hypothetical protein